MAARMLKTALAALLAALALTGTAHARGGNYLLDGGTKQQQAQVRGALAASSFDWGLVRRRITIHIGRGFRTEALPGRIWIDAKLLDSGVFAWGIVQHEYAHQVDFFLLDDPKRADVLGALGGRSWWQVAGSHADHADLGSERFASTLAWSYWPSAANSLKPQSEHDESAAMAPATFRALMAEMIGAPASFRTR
jgi:hypothetical protein